MKKEIRNNNTKGQCHGYQEWYGIGNKLFIRTTFKNGRLIGYSEWHNAKETNYIIR